MRRTVDVILKEIESEYVGVRCYRDPTDPDWMVCEVPSDSKVSFEREFHVMTIQELRRRLARYYPLLAIHYNMARMGRVVSR